MINSQEKNTAVSGKIISENITYSTQSSESSGEESSEELSDIDFESFEDAIISGTCTCGAKSRAHKRTCPKSSRMCYTKKITPGDYVCIHSSTLKDKHITCRVVQRVANRYKLYCKSGALAGTYPETEVVKSNSSLSIPLDQWRTSPTVTIRDARSDSRNLEDCDCVFARSAQEVVDLTDITNEDSNCKDKIWVEKPLYTLNEMDHYTVTSPSGWLNDKIITASQLLLQQQFPNVGGLQSPVLEQDNGFQIHTGAFAQILNVGDSHWVLVSNIGCDSGVVNVYDTLYQSLPSSTLCTIANLVFCRTSTLSIKMVDVELQKNASDCGVLCLAMAYDICLKQAPCVARYNSKLIREHLEQCLQNGSLSSFPLLGRLSSTITYKYQKDVELFCVCYLPDIEGQEGNVDDGPMAECESCENWFHKHCLEIPEEVFNVEGTSWICQQCTQNNHTSLS